MGSYLGQMKMPKEKPDNGNNKATEGVEGILHGLGQRRGQWIMCAALLLLIVTATLNVVPRDQHSVKLPSYNNYAMISSTMSNSHGQHPPFQNWHNLLVEESSNYTSTLLSLLDLNATSDSPCFTASTKYARLVGLPEPLAGKLLFGTDVLHRLTLVALEDNGQSRCAGGDYFEVDFHNDHYRSRPPTVDFGNGSYGIDLIVPSRFAGSFIIEISLLYGNFHGLEHVPDQWAKMEVILIERFEMVAQFDGHHDIVQPAPLKQCTPSDFFDRTSWQGRWIRSNFNETCEADQSEKRFRCLSEDDELQFQCEEPWCYGPVGRLESNGWVYSAHCSFKIFRPQEAWDCLDGRWFLTWGDSNFQDTIRNLLLFVLDWPLPAGEWISHFVLARNFEHAFVNPRLYDQTFRVSQVWNGAIDDVNEGLDTLIKHEEHQQRLMAYFNKSRTRWPDTIVMNSGMHDGVHWWNTENFVEAVDWTIDWWTKLYTSIPLERRPQLLWRTTIAPAGLVRHMPANPNKNEMYNHVMMEKLLEVRDVLPVKFVDTFDLTFPFHYDNNYSDGGHYGRPPGLFESPWMGAPHWYFVDIMLAHIFLNALCPSK